MEGLQNIQLTRLEQNMGLDIVMLSVLKNRLLQDKLLRRNGVIMEPVVRSLICGKQTERLMSILHIPARCLDIIVVQEQVNVVLMIRDIMGFAIRTVVDLIHLEMAINSSMVLDLTLMLIPLNLSLSLLSF